MLRLDMPHQLHGEAVMHIHRVTMEQQQHRAGKTSEGEDPWRQGRLPSSSEPLIFDYSHSKKDESKHLVLQVLNIVVHGVPQALRAHRPNFCVTEEEKEEAGQKKAERPEQ